MDNSAETIEFLSDCRKALHAGRSMKSAFVTMRGDKMPRVRRYFDFSDIKYISTAAAVVLVAEFYRIATLTEERPPAININDWDSSVVFRLFQLGFFAELNISMAELPPFIEDQTTVSMPVLAGNTGPFEASDQAFTSLLRLVEALNISEQTPDTIVTYILTALHEAMVNVTHHAYPKDHKYEFEPINKWWMAASADKKRKRLSVVFFDQGATIPITYPKRSLTQAAHQFLSKVLLQPIHEYSNDAAYVESAVQYGASQTGRRRRGKGLPQMRDTISMLGKGSLRIWSRGGKVVYQAGRKITEVTKSDHPHSIGGTLIEWLVEFEDEEVLA